MNFLPPNQTGTWVLVWVWGPKPQEWPQDLPLPSMSSQGWGWGAAGPRHPGALCLSFVVEGSPGGQREVAQARPDNLEKTEGGKVVSI